MKKNGRKPCGKQLYKWHACGKQFVTGDRISAQQLWHEYVYQKQTYQQLADQHGCDIRTILRKVDRFQVAAPAAASLKRSTTVCIDSTYWGRGFGVLVVLDSPINRVYHQFIEAETVALYLRVLPC